MKIRKPKSADQPRFNIDALRKLAGAQEHASHNLEDGLGEGQGRIGAGICQDSEYCDPLLMLVPTIAEG